MLQPNTGGVYVYDYNSDGHLDVLIDDIAAGARLYQGDGTGHFEDVTELAGLRIPSDDEPPLWALSCWADFDGDGVTEVAAVVTPHLSGRLTIFQRDGTKFEREAERSGYSTHFIGSTVLDMSIIEDVNGDGVPDIILPSLDRDRLAVVSFAGGTPR